MADDDNVVSLGVRQKKSDPDRTVEKVHGSQCFHPRFLVDDKLAEVECADCHERLSPMWVLGQIANHESSQAVRRDKLRMLVKQLSEKVKYKCRHCGKMNDMSRLVKIRRD